MTEYADRDHEALGEHYTRHVSAMTAEGLYAKSDIAAELAWRDAEIERLRTLAAERECSVPEGWKLVPVEPTLDMLRTELADKHAPFEMSFYRRKEVYSAMLAASPSIQEP